MGKFHQISTELCPLVYVRNSFSLSIFVIFLPICMRVDTGKKCLGTADGTISTNNFRVMALD